MAKRNRFSKELKARVALEAIKGDKTVAQLSSQYGVHAFQGNDWKKRAQDQMVDAFERGGERRTRQDIEAREDRLYREIGELQAEVKWNVSTCFQHFGDCFYVTTSGSSV